VAFGALASAGGSKAAGGADRLDRVGLR
jgi:hypothetical protein